MLSIQRIIFYSLVNIFNAAVFTILWTRNGAWRLFFFMTLLSFWSKLFYFASTFFLELRAHFTHNHSTVMLPFMRNHFFKYSAVISTLVVTGFYTLLILGPLFLSLDNDALDWVFTVFLHGGEYCFVIADFFLMPHSYIPTFKKDILIIGAIYITYGIIVCISVYGFGNYPYKFLENVNWAQMAVASTIIFMMLCNFYMFYQLMLRTKMNITIVHPTVMVDGKTESEISMISSVNETQTTSKRELRNL